jgi:DNA-binding response OmpR family regulator
LSNNLILVVEDDKNIAELVRLYLRNEGFRVEIARTGREALERHRTLKPSLVVLDLMLPEIDGLEVCRRLRREANTPVIMLTARSDDVDKIVGLELGADDYVTKPFNPRELVARVKAVLRRAESHPAQEAEEVITVGDVTLDTARREVHAGGRPLTLRAKEFDLLAALLRHPGVVMSRERLLSEVWGYEWAGDTRTVDVHIAWLRDKLAGSTVRIETVWGVGYKLVPPSTSPGLPARERPAGEVRT